MKIKLTILLSFLLIITGCSDKAESNENNKIKQSEEIKIKKSEKKIIYPIKLKTIDEKIIDVNQTNTGFSFSSSKNKSVLLTFFTSWCPPCKAEIPHLNNLQKKYKGKLDIIGVLLEDKNIGEIKSFIKKYNVKYTVTYGKENFTLAKAAGDVKAIPFSILYDKSGAYATHYTGAIPEEMMNIDIKKAVR